MKAKKNAPKLKKIILHAKFTIRLEAYVEREFLTSSGNESFLPKILAADIPISIYKAVQTKGKRKAGGDRNGCFIAERFIFPRVRKAERSPTPSAIKQEII